MSEAKINNVAPAVVVEVSTVEVYMEPISGKKFKTRIAAEKHGVKMKAAQELQLMEEARAAKWGEVAGMSNLLECLQSVVESQLLEWEIKLGLAAGAKKPCWVEGSVRTCMLIPGAVAVEVAFWLQMDRYSTFKSYVEFTHEGLLGKKLTTLAGFGNGFSTVRSTEGIGIRTERRRSAKESKSGVEEQQFVLRTHLMLSDHPLLAEGVRKTLEAVAQERVRRFDLEDQTVEVLREHAVLSQMGREVDELRARLRDMETKKKQLELAVRESVATLPEYAKGKAEWDGVSSAVGVKHDLEKLVKLDDYDLNALKAAVV